MIDTTKAKADAEEGLRIAEEATNGPWNKADCVSPKIVIYAVPQGPHGFGDSKTLYLGETYCDQAGKGRANLTFIADSRTRAPEAYRNVIALAEENERLRAEVARCGKLELDHLRIDSLRLGDLIAMQEKVTALEAEVERWRSGAIEAVRRQRERDEAIEQGSR